MQPRARATLFPKNANLSHAYSPPPLGWALNSIRPPPASAPRPKLLSPGSGVWGCQPALWGAAGDPVGREPALTMSRGSSGRAYGVFAFGSLRGRGRCGSCVGRLRGCFMGPNVDPLRGLCGGGGRGRAAQAVKKMHTQPGIKNQGGTLDPVTPCASPPLCSPAPFALRSSPAPFGRGMYRASRGSRRVVVNVPRFVDTVSGASPGR